MTENEDAATATEDMDEVISITEPIELNDEPENTKITAQGSSETQGRDGGGDFREPAFTFLTPDDPVLVSCL